MNKEKQQMQEAADYIKAVQQSNQSNDRLRSGISPSASAIHFGKGDGDTVRFDHSSVLGSDVVQFDNNLTESELTTLEDLCSMLRNDSKLNTIGDSNEQRSKEG
jgi:hypothetical protein